MFKIAKITKQIFRSARNIGKYCSQSKGYVEDTADEFTFLKALPSQSIKPLIQDTFKAFNPDLQNIAKVKSTQLLDSAEIYARFADEIIAKPKKIVENKNLETKDNNTREHIEDFTTNDITEEFKMFKEQGYDFAATREVLQNRNQDTNQSPKSIFERMKELSISGYLSNYAGYPQLREDIENAILQKELVINEFMATVTSHIEDPEEYSSELLG